MWKRIKRWWQAEGALAHLHGVSDRMLADMGLEREGLRDRVFGSGTDPDTPACACRPTGRLVSD